MRGGCGRVPLIEMIDHAMRPVWILLGCLLLALLALAGPAGAVPVVTLKLEPVPIPGQPHTGYILGHGAALEAEYRISGTEYGGFPHR